MSEQNLRAVTQRSGIIDLPDGSTLEIRPLTLRDWGTLEEEAVAAARRDLLSTTLKNLDLFPEEERAGLRLAALERAEQLTGENLPEKEVEGPAVGADGKPITAAYKAGDQVQLANGETGIVTKTINGVVIAKQMVSYPMWWMSTTFKGRLMAAWLSCRRANPKLSLDDISDLFQKVGEQTLDNVANSVGAISKPTLGNGEAPPEAGPNEN